MPRMLHAFSELFTCILVHVNNSQIDKFSGGTHGGEGGWVLGSGFAGYVPLASQNPHPIIVYSVANYRPHPSHFWANAIVIMRADC